jgi:peptidyl-prolyl cis-trans isomerase A (cyclophilin A)/peptidyl-prolyl cis-trans isomerase B (cyclophilin B)
MVRISLFALVSVVGLLSGCGGKSAAPQGETAKAAGSSPATSVEITPTSATRSPAATAPAPDPIVTLHTTAGDIKVQLFAAKAPRTVENFLRGYAERGYYDQTIFHHVEPGRMLIAGGYSAEMERKPERAAIYNESRGGLSNRRSTVAMVREPDAPHSATADFFINLADNPAFDHRTEGEDEQHGYCVFGEVISGMDVVDRIAQQSTTAKGDFPRIPSPAVTISSIERVQ